MRYSLLIFFSLLFLLPQLSSAAEIRIGIDNNPPLTFIDKQGEAQGIFPELFQLIAENRGWSITYIPCQWQQCLESLSTGDIDILPAIAYTKQRATEFNFARETVINSWGHIYHRNNSQCNSILELNGKKLAVLAKDVYYVGNQGLLQVARNFDLKINYVEVPSYQEAFSLLATGKVDAAMVGRFYGIKNSQKFKLLPSPVMIKPIQVRPAFSPEIPQKYVDEFDKSLQNWKQSADSRYYQIIDKWLGEKKPARLPHWLKIVIYSLVAILCLLSLLTLLTRKQIKIKTLQLAEKNRLLEKELVEKQEVEQTLEERNQFLQSVIDGVSDPMLVIGLDYKILQMNKAASKLMNGRSGELTDVTCHQLSHNSLVPCDGNNHPCPLLEVRETMIPVTMIHHHESEQGRRIVELTASPLFDSTGQLYAIIEVSRDITDRLQIEELLNENEKHLHHLAHHDSLTNLPNRLLFEDRLTQALSKARRSRRQVALFFLDLDHLKEINDNLGHDYGDLLLIDIAKRLRKCVRESDTVARLGGDEFLILMEEVESIEMIETMAERICSALSHDLSKGDFTQKISASIGISIYPEDATTNQEMMKNADLAMYRVKKTGKASYQFYSNPQGRFLFD